MRIASTTGSAPRLNASLVISFPPADYHTDTMWHAAAESNGHLDLQRPKASRARTAKPRLLVGSRTFWSRTVWYNWVRIHKSLRVTPAMAAGLTDRLWTWEEIVELMDVALREAILAKRRA